MDVDSDAARGKLAEALNDFQNDGSRAFQGLKAEQQDLFDSIAQNTEKTRDKTVIEVTKTRDRINQRLEPFWRKLKLKQKIVKTDFDKIKKSAEDAGKAAVKAFGEGGGGEVLAGVERELIRARQDAEKAAESLAKAETELARTRATVEAATARAQAAQERLSVAMSAGQRAVDDLQKAERELAEARATGNTDAIATAEANLEKARERVATRSAAAAEAEAKVVVARSATAAANDRIVASEEKFVAARDKVTESADRVVDAENRVVQAHDRSSQAAERHNTVLGRIRDTVTRMTTDTDRGGRAFAGLGAAISGATAFGRVFGAIGRTLGTVITGVSNAADTATGAMNFLAGGLLGVAAGFIKLGAQSMVFVGIGGLVAYAVGAIGAALAGIPALAMGAAAAFAVVALGMDGIKKAYEVGLKPALDKLKVQISDVFEKTLTPAFKQLGDVLIPAVTNEMQGLAQEVANTGVAIIDMVTQGENVKKIEAIINNTASSVKNQLKPALVGIVQEFINIGAQKPIMDAMVGVISDLINNTQQWLAKMQELNLIVPAVQALRRTLDTVERAFFAVLTSATRFFIQVQPGFDRLVEGVTSVVTALLDRLGPAFNQILTAIGDGLKQIGPEVWDGLRDAVQRVADVLKRMADNGNLKAFFETLVRLVTMGITAFENFISAVDNVTSALRAVDEWAKPFDDLVNDGLRPFGLAFDQLPGQVQDGVDGAGSAVEGLPGTVQPPMNETATAVEEAARRAQEAAQQGGQGTHDGWVDGINPIPGATQVTFDTLPRNVQDAMTNSITAATVGSDLIKVAVETGFTAAANAAQIATGRLSTETSTAFQTMQTSVTTHMEGIRTAVETGTQAMQTAFQTLSTSVGNSADIIVQALQKAQQAALNFQTTASDAFRMTEQAAQQLGQTVTSVMTAMLDSVTTTMTGIQTAVTTAFEQVKTVITTSMEQVKTVVDTTMTQVRTTIQTNLQQILQNFQQAMQQVVQAVQQGMQQMNAAITAGGAQAVAKCREIAQQILEVFRQLAPQLEAAGRTMMERLAAGITAGGAAAVAAARNVAAQIKAQFPSSPAKEGPLSGRGDPLRTGGVIIQRLADGMRSAQSYLMRQLIPIMNATANIIARPGATRPANGWTVSTSTPTEPSAIRLLDTPSSAPDIFRGQVPGLGGGKWNASNGGILAEDGSYVNPNFYDKKPSGPSAQDIRSALEGMSIRFDDRGNGLAKLVASQQRSLARR